MTGEARVRREAAACTAAARPPAVRAPRGSKSAAKTLAELAEENDWKNDVVLFWVPPQIRCWRPPAVAT